MSFDRVLALFKFGKKEHIEQFIHEGLLYMNSLNYFKILENDMLRTDKHESASYSVPGDGAKLRFEHNGNLEEFTVTGPIVSSDGIEHDTNIFCMYAFRESASKDLIDPRNLNFGDTFAVLIDGDEFLRRVHEIAKKENINLEQGLVEYVDKDSYSSKMGVFRKFSDFAYQSEFRLSVVTGKENPFLMRIGDISDISMTGSLKEINRRIEISAKKMIIH